MHPEATAAHVARWWTPRSDGRIECQLCPRRCKLADGQRGFCFVRQRAGNRLVLSTYGRTSGIAIDPIEKKPLYHFLPGTRVLSFGTAGCNLGCRFCQNWSISKATELDRTTATASPAQIAAMAQRNDCPSVAFTYNDPVIFAEYAIDVAQACRAHGIHPVAVTAGYLTPDARPSFFDAMDAANVDLKAFSERFYRRLCYGQLGPVLDTLIYLRRQTSVWLEVTTLLIPGENDSDAELERMTDWFAGHLGSDVPWHFTAYHPDYKLAAPPTPLATVKRAQAIARSKGIKYAYTGNVADPTGGTTWCANCARPLVRRNGFRIESYDLEEGRCRFCGHPVPGRFEARCDASKPRGTPIPMR